MRADAKLTEQSRSHDLPVPSWSTVLGPEIVLDLDPDGLLGQFNRAGILAAADVHVARALGRLGGDDNQRVALAVAFAVRAPRVGHVLADLASVQATVVADDYQAEAEDVDVDIAALPWPRLDTWLEEVAASPLVANGGVTAGGGAGGGAGEAHGPDDVPARAPAPPKRPLRLVGSALYLDRYWGDECLVAREILSRAAAKPPAVDAEQLAKGLSRLFPEDPTGPQALAAARAVGKLVSVIAGGPGTGKTTTVARVLALLEEQAALAGRPPLLIALAAPTGKAAARVAESVHGEAGRLDVAQSVRDRLAVLDASTVHRLLGRHPAGANRSRHDHTDRLPHDVVVVDETSMMSLPLMARLVDAVRPEARLVLIGDHEQLASVEAGAVLADIVGPAADGPGLTTSPQAPFPVSGCITVLRANHRFSGPLAELAQAVRAGDADGVVDLLRHPPCSPAASSAGIDAVPADVTVPVRWLDIDLPVADGDVLAPVRAQVVGAGRRLLEVAERSDGAAALEVLSEVRVLCAHRAGPAGAGTWNALAEQWIGIGPSKASPGGGWYLGRPVIVTENDYGLELFNGDTGVAIKREDGGLTVAFRRRTDVVTVSPSLLASVETAFAMTAHRSQGSEVDHVVVVLPTSSRILTRELLYTALTRARRSVTVVGGEASVRSAVTRRVSRASGLTARLWGTAR